MSFHRTTARKRLEALGLRGPLLSSAAELGLYADRLPPRLFDPDALLAQVGKAERADPYVIELNREALAEAHARLGAVLGEG